LFGNDNIHKEEFICSVDKYQPPQWRENGFGQGGGRVRKHKIQVSFCPKIAKHLHQPKMFNESRVFLHFPVIESKWELGVEPPAVGELRDLLTK